MAKLCTSWSRSWDGGGGTRELAGMHELQRGRNSGREGRSPPNAGTGSRAGWSRETPPRPLPCLPSRDRRSPVPARTLTKGSRGCRRGHAAPSNQRYELTHSSLTTNSAHDLRNARSIAAIGVIALIGVLCVAAMQSGKPPPAEARSATMLAARDSATRRASPDTLPRTWIEMKGVNLRVATDAVVGIRSLRGEVIPTTPGASAFLDSTTSFSIRITSGTVALRSADLGVILNRSEERRVGKERRCRWGLCL